MSESTEAAFHRVVAAAFHDNLGERAFIALGDHGRTEFANRNDFSPEEMDMAMFELQSRIDERQESRFPDLVARGGAWALRGNCQ